MSLQRTYLVAWCIGLAALLSGPAFAEAPQAQADSSSERRVASSFKRVRADVLRKTLALNERNASAVERILDQHVPERKSLRKGIEEQQRALSELLKKDSNDQAAYQRALDLLASHQAKLNALRQTEQVELAKWMTPKQRAQLLDVMADVRRKKQAHKPR
jgi:Spy/CpxP family protein refolding chaperone